MASQEALLRQAILDRPDDNTCRLIYADWLEEQGDPRAEFVRLQCELEPISYDDDRRTLMVQRINELENEFGREWKAEDLGEENSEINATFVRGFVGEISVSAPTLLSRAEEMLGRAPVRVVKLREAKHAMAGLATCPALDRVHRLEFLGRGRDVLGDEGIGHLTNSPYFHGLRELIVDSQDIGWSGIKQLSESRLLGQLEVLDLSNNRVWANETEFLVRSGQLGNLRTLVLANNPHLGIIGLQWIADCRDLANLKHLDLTNSSDLSSSGFQSLARSGNFPKLQQLTLSHNYVANDGIEALAQADFPELVELDLEECRIGGLGLRSLCRSNSLPNLRYLCLANNRFGPDQVRYLREWKGPFPVWLDLSQNPITDDGTKLLTECSHFSELRELYLNHCDLGPWGVHAIAKSENMSRLRTLHLSGNHFDDDVLRALGAFPPMAGLRDIALANSEITDEGLKILCNSRYVQGVKALDLMETNVTDEGLKHFVESSFASNLTELAISGDNITADGYESIMRSENMNGLLSLKGTGTYPQETVNEWVRQCCARTVHWE
ncbi:MAG: TIGR02996 domain-containing protein [Gemmataceae bacterium]